MTRWYSPDGWSAQRRVATGVPELQRYVEVFVGEGEQEQHVAGAIAKEEWHMQLGSACRRSHCKGRMAHATR
jgi:hypothetical protein